MSAFLNLVLQFVISASDPHQACELSHRDPDVAGTYYLYCSQMSPDGIELISVGRFISDAKAAKAAP
jgi:hypothetical protein